MEWVKALHVISVIAWMAGLLYLPRLFVYHCDAVHGSVQSDTFIIMERRLLKAIMTPAMIASWIFGLWLVFGFQMASIGDIWAWIKGLGVIGLTGVHVHLAGHQKAFAAGENKKPSRYFRLINEVPTILMILIVIMVIVKPF
ncbi:protoporphyrinogen oxidase HemJ [Maritalea porphyrae]|jgi:putative membrane protein|uniref:protoporphyrinogen oxidase HemJ n=1 Tax=Maritalea porphyrae TaxID=880732 RepID=UPI0022AFBABA|nr:protoporphyrinogen oxidase HemJ [Maritalea porphyrae]MCZ4272257.1 protoporphyrinogen oxidase HemJ [Maritalea porphyrae]